MSIQALRERLAATSKEAKNLLAEKGEQKWSKEDQQKFDNLMDDCESLEAQIKAHEKLIEQDREDNFRDADDHRLSNSERRDKNRSENMVIFENYVRKSSKEMSVEEALAVRNTMSTTTGSEGGYTVQSEVARRLIDAAKAYAFMRAVAGQITTTQGNPLSFPTSDGTAEVGEWVPQNTTASDSDPSFGTIALNVFKASSKTIAIPIELLQDTNIDIMAFIMGRLAQRIGRISNLGYTTGDGVTMPKGMMTAASVGKTGATGQTTTVVYDDLVDMAESVDVAYLSGPGMGWMMPQSMRKVVRKIKDTAGRPIWVPSYDGGIQSKAPDELLGYPVRLNNDIAAPAANAKSLAFGDFSQYQIRDALDVTIFRFDDSAYMKKGQVGFLAWARTGGNLLDLNAVKTYQHSAT